MSDSDKTEPTRRDVIHVATGAVGAVGVAMVAWPLIDQMNPDASALALSSVEVDLSSVEEGQAITVVWRKKPIYIRFRLPEEIKQARSVPLEELKDPETDEARVERPEWLVMIGICTHFGCLPKGQKSGDKKGDYNGWFCPCHGSHYDTSGRIRRGPAPRNLEIPPYVFVDNTTLKIG